MMTREQIIKAGERLRLLTPDEIEAYELAPIPSENEVRAYIADYKKRISLLFSDIEKWLKEDGRYTARPGEPAYIFEPLMAMYDIPEEEVPTLSIVTTEDIETLRFRPNGLWVVPTNGRIAIDTPNAPIRRRRHDMRLLDKAAGPFQEAKWLLRGAEQNIMASEPFSREALLRIIERQHEAI